jgi:hypothetical protein
MAAPAVTPLGPTPAPALAESVPEPPEGGPTSMMPLRSSLPFFGSSSRQALVRRPSDAKMPRENEGKDRR